MSRMLSLLFAVVALIVPVVTVADTPERTSTVADRHLVNVTVYNGGTALVHDRRRVFLNAGVNRIAWRDVSANMDPSSALLEDVDAPGNVNVLEQNFDFDLLDPSALLQRYVGRDVTVVHDPRFAGERATRETARVLSTNGGIVLQYRDRIETEVRGHIAFPVSSKNFRDKPTLVLDLASTHGGAQTLDLSYLTGGMSWHADYVGVLDPDEKHLALTGLVTLSNTSGASYDNAHLQLVAGNVNVVQPGVVADTFKTIARVTSRNVFSQENYFEYHLYTLDRPTTILNAQTKQLSLLAAHDVPVRKTLELRGSPSYYQSAEADLGDRLPVGVYVSFENRGGDLGIPLPAGVVRLYKNDSRNLSEFLGSDRIEHTPKNESVRLHLGDSFDVTARKRQTDFQFMGGCSADSSYEITVANAKSIAQNVLVVESIPGSWRILDESAKHTKTSASTATWTLPVAPGGHTTLTYTARVSWC
ncbi:MAG TPA: DUF4139 domain-containing protein [Candidatus Baltobacteraceae bacterium]